MALPKMVPRPDVPGMQEIEVLTTEIETRCRETIVQIIKPSLDLVRKLERSEDNLKRKVDKHEGILNTVADLTVSVNDTSELLVVAQSQLAEFDQRLREATESMEKEFQDSRAREHERTKQIKDMGSTISHQEREIERLWQEIGRVQNANAEEVRNIWAGHSKTQEKINEVQDDLDRKDKDLRNQLLELEQTLFGEDHNRGFFAIRKSINDIQDFIEPLPAVRTALGETMERQADLGQRMIVCEEKVKANRELLDGFRVYVDKNVEEAKSLFEKTANNLVSHHACLMQDLRRQYADELKVHAERRDETVVWQKKTEDIYLEVTQQVTSLEKRVEAWHQQINTEMQDLHKAQKKSRMSTEAEEEKVREALESYEPRYWRLSAAVEHVASVTGMVLECLHLSNALGIQDFADRRAESWVGPLSDLARKPAEAMTAKGLQGIRGDDVHKAQKVVIPWRDGMAKQGYMPGAVTFRDQTLPRVQVLWLHDNLLSKAKGAFYQVPAAAPPSPPKVPPRAQELPREQPQTAEQEPHGGAPDAQADGRMAREQAWRPEPAAGGQEWIPFRSPAKVRLQDSDGNDRGGTPTGRSLGQPGAVGSRGAADGPLGETVPPRYGSKQPGARDGGRAEPGVKLPLINLGAGGKGAAPKSLTAR